MRFNTERLTVHRAVAGSASADAYLQRWPVNKTFGQAQWLVYSCNDASTLIVVSGPGNPASPSYFSFSLEGSSHHIRGEGTGSKPASDAAYNELQALSASAIRGLIEQTKHVGK